MKRRRYDLEFKQRIIQQVQEIGNAAAVAKRVKQQILKDVALINAKEIEGAHWHFFRSTVTGRIGASQSLRTFLEQNGIKYTIHE
ncbi:hypothetical protein [Effusibacillus pohliae]|uniref:hypothetical protein n=1 Tax=Effusibacillus pohliae TaxID=232270 RepID=UPI000362D943|nr:hypothetical protein [Effusibacillus pohliae]